MNEIDPVQQLLALRAARKTVIINGREVYTAPDGTINTHTLLGGTVELKTAYGAPVELSPEGLTFPSLAGLYSADDDIGKGTPVITVDPHNPRSVRCYVKGISDETLDEVLREHFSRFGTLIDVDVKKEQKTKAHRGIGFLTFNPLTDVAGLFGPYSHKIAKRPIYVILANPSTDKRNSEMQFGVKRDRPM